MNLTTEFRVGDRVTDGSVLGIVRDIPNQEMLWVIVDGDTKYKAHGWHKTKTILVNKEIATVSEAVKHDQGKYDPTMLSVEMLELVSKVRMFGAKKYARGNWKKGFKQTRSLAAALRHIFAYMNGEDNDPESGLSHLGHAICGIEHCIYDSIHHPENDDRKE